MASEVSEEEGSYASRFYRWFLKSYKSCLLLLVALPSLIDTLPQLLPWRSLLWLSMTWRWRYLTQNNFLSTTSLAWSLALQLLFCFSQEKLLQWKKINTHTHAHTHTHTHTHTLLVILLFSPINYLLFLPKIRKRFNWSGKKWALVKRFFSFSLCTI